MKNSQFNSGNYNDWDNIVKKILPQINKTLRYTAIPTIDEKLALMVGSNAEIIKESIDIEQIVDRDGLKGIKALITYYVDEFKVPNAPQDAIDTDETSLREFLNCDTFEVVDINIDTNDGMLNLTIEFLIEDFAEDDEV